MCFRGGGNRGVGSDIVREIELAAKQLGSEAAKVGRHCEIADEWLTRGARNIIHICDSNMNGSSEREAISRRYADSETKEVSEIKDAKALRRKGDKLVSEKDAIGRHSERNNNFIPKNFLLSNQEIDNSCNSRHSERLAKESSDTNNLIQLQGIKINSTETDHASKPLGIFASKNLAASLPSRLAAKRVAFTLAEVLITLGIIGVVAALTIPNVIKQYQDRVTVTKLQKAYSVLNQAFRQSENDNGSSEFWQETDEIGTKAYFEKYWKPYFVEPQLCKTYKECGYASVAPYSYKDGSHSALGISSSRVFFKTADDVFYFFTDSSTGSSGNVVPLKNVYIDINGAKAPNKFGEDVFVFNRVAGKGIIPNGYKDTYNSLATDCKKYGTQCAAQIIAAGWKIKN